MNDLWVHISVLVLTLWVLVWKGYALWTAAQRRERTWFIVLLIVNTISILDIFYIFQIAKKSRKDVWNVFNKNIFSLGEWNRPKADQPGAGDKDVTI